MNNSPPRPLARPRGLIRLGNLLLALLRRLLYLVVRTRVTPEQAAALGIDPQQPLCYVLQDRHLSSLLVLEEETRRLGLPSALAPIGPEFPRSERAVFSVILNRNPLSTRTAEPSVDARADDGGAAARAGARRAAAAGDDPLGPLAGVAGFARQGAASPTRGRAWDRCASS